jgi:hypothetical protein
MVEIVKELVKKNSRRIWGYFTLSDGSKTQFECTKEDRERLGKEAWFQWGNREENLWASVKRVEELVREWEKDI